MRRALSYALAISGLSVTAHAGDSDGAGVKDALPEKLSWGGVTLYGTIDLGYAYQNHGAPLGGSFPQTLEYNLWSSKNANKEISSLAASALQRSSIGLQVEEDVGAGWRAIGRIDTAFNPLSGELSDGPASLLRNFGVPLANQSANGDSNRAGQILNGTAYAGVSNAAYGTLTVGRQETLQGEVLRAYDPQRLAYAFSLLGWSSSFAAAGGGEAARWNNSVKYTYSYGPLHAGGHYTNGGADTAIFGGAYGFNVGGSYRGFSLDAVYQKEMSVVSAAAASPTTLKATISDNQSWSVQGKYGFELPGVCDCEASSAKLTVFAGYENISFANPSSNPHLGSTTVGGYIISAVVLNPYNTDRVLQVALDGREI